MGIIYQGSFYGHKPFANHDLNPDHPEGDQGYFNTSRLWDVAISRAGYDGEAGELDFPADSPLTIEWDGVKPEDVVEGSTATLRVFSPLFDRYADLYTVDPGDAPVLEVSTGGRVVWRGTLDPELYAQPYSYSDGVALEGETPSGPGFVTELTFSDFAPMERAFFSGAGRLSLAEVIGKALAPTCFTGYSTRLSTVIGNPYSGNASDEKPLPGNTFIAADNFFDEDSTPMDMREALETVLRPFAIHLRQYGGRPWLYDWNALALEAPGREIAWTAADATMEIAPVAHAVNLTYSTYADTTLVSSALDIGALERTTEEVVSAYHVDGAKERVFGFNLYRYATAGEGVVPRGVDLHGRELFRIEPGYSGSAASGVYYYARSMPGVSAIDGKPVEIGTGGGVTGGTGTVGDALMTLTGPTLSLSDQLTYQIRVTLEMLLDVRYNPYETASKDNCKKAWDNMQKNLNYGYIPVSLEYVDAADHTKVWHYTNAGTKQSQSLDADNGWVEGPAPKKAMWLAYYDPGARDKASGWGGWKKNRQCIGFYRKDLPAISEKRGDGEYIPLPAVAGTAVGFLRLTVYEGFDWMDHDGHGPGGGTSYSPDEDIRWLLYGEATMEIVRADGTAIDTDDVIYTATAIDGAAADVDVTLKAGSAVKAPTARAALATIGANAGGRAGVGYFPAGKSTFMRRRADGSLRSDSLEALLLDSLVSQYDTPHRLLIGEVDILDILGAVKQPGAASYEPITLTDALSPERRFIPTAVSADILRGTASATFREISPDSYHPANN